MRGEACRKIHDQTSFVPGTTLLSEVNPLVCPKCQGEMKIIAFIIAYDAVDRIIHHLKLRFATEKAPLPCVFEQAVPMTAEAGAEYL